MRNIFLGLCLSGMLLAAGFGAFLRPLLFTMTPLQRHYLGAYLASSWRENNPAATTEIRWIWKFKPQADGHQKKLPKKGSPKFQYEMATESDVLSIPARELFWKGDVLPFWMTRKAEVDGWSGIEQGLPREVSSAQLAALLREDFYAGEPAWRFFVQPGLLLVCGGLLLWMVQRQVSAYRKKHFWTLLSVPLWRHVGQRVLAGGADFGRGSAPDFQPLALPSPASDRVLDAVPTELKAVPKVVAAHPSRATIRQASTSESAPAKPKPKATFWDEAKSIE